MVPWSFGIVVIHTMFEERFLKTAPLIEQEIVRFMPKGSIANLYDGVEHAMTSKGKRLRPFLCVETARLLGSEKAIPFAAACEVMHNWLLVHDDIQDGDEIRREKPTVWKKFGIAHAINVGDIMANEVFEIILRSDVEKQKVLELIELTIKTVRETVEGQSIELNATNSENFNEKEYITVAMKKTGYYLACPMIGAAIIAGAGKGITSSLLEYGKNAGTAFQIIDDIIDLTPEKGRDAGSDIKGGKKTLMVLHLLKNCSGKEEQRVLDILKKPREETTTDDISYIKELFEEYGSISYATEKSREFTQKAKESISKEVPDNLKSFLHEFADFIVQK